MLLILTNVKRKEIKKEEIEFFYRGTNLSKDLIITSVRLKGIVSSENIEKKQNEMITRKKQSQPKPNQNLWKHL